MAYGAILGQTFVTNTQLNSEIKNIQNNYITKVNGELVGPLNANNYSINNLANGVNDGDAVNLLQLNSNLNPFQNTNLNFVSQYSGNILNQTGTYMTLLNKYVNNPSWGSYYQMNIIINPERPSLVFTYPYFFYLFNRGNYNYIILPIPYYSSNTNGIETYGTIKLTNLYRGNGVVQFALQLELSIPGPYSCFYNIKSYN